MARNPVIQSMADLRSAWWPRRGERLEPILSAILLVVAFPPMHAPMLPFLGLVPLTLWVRAQSGDAEGRAAVLRGSALFGAVYFGLLLYWILVALVWFTKLAVLAFVASVAVLAGMSALFGLALHHGIHRLRLPLWVALPVTWTALEWTRANLPSTLAFPWLGLGTSLTGFPELVGIAELVGARGVTFWMALVNGLVAVTVLRTRSRPPWRGALATALVVVAPMAWGVWRARTLETRPAATVAVVQPNVPEHVKLDADLSIDSTLAALDRLVPEIPPGVASLVVFPEVTLRSFPDVTPDAPEVRRVQAYAREVGAPVLFGALGWDAERAAPLNSAFVTEPQGLTDFRYDKRHLVPFVERAPFVGRLASGRSEYLGGYLPGTDATLLEAETAAYGVLVCYESSFPEAARRYRSAGADVLVNITNDAWYGREPIWSRTTALWQHPAHMVMRAIENRVGVARAANTGISMFVDPVGRIHDATPLFAEEVRVAEVRTSDVITLYTRLGDWVGTGSALATLLLVLAAVRVGDRPTTRDGDS